MGDDVLERYRTALGTDDVITFPADPLDRLGVPVETAAVWPADGGPLRNGVGYGTTRRAAQLSAFGECVEVTWAYATLPRLPRRRAGFAELEDALDPRAACLPAGSDWTPQQELTWVPLRRERDGAQMWVPVELAATSGADLRDEPRDGLLTPITNGLGAGDSRERALAHALLELIQRDGNSVAYRALDRGVVVELDDVRDEGARDLLARLDDAGLDVTVKLADDDLGIVSLYAVGAERDLDRVPFNLQVTAAGEAAHPDRDVALRKCLAELCAARSRKRLSHGPLADVAPLVPPRYLDRIRAEDPGAEESRALQATCEWLRTDTTTLRGRVARILDHERERIPFSSLPTRAADDPAQVLAIVAEALHRAGMDVLVLDLQPPDGVSAPGVHAVKALAVGRDGTGLEVETMSYGRLGERGVRRLLDHPALPEPLATVVERPPGTDWAPVPLPAASERRLGGPAWFDRSAADRVVGDLYALYREPGRHLAPLAMERAS